MATRRKPTRRPAPPESVPPRPRSAPILFLAATILAAGTWAYSTSFSGILVLDDIRAIARNPTIRTLWPPITPLSPPSHATVSGRPLANLSFAINYAAAPIRARDVYEPAKSADASSGGDPFLRNVRGYHALNLLIHLAAALALFGTVRRTLLTGALRARFEPAAAWLACAVALVWVVHPLTTAAVTYVVQRVESLMGLFYLLTVYSAIRASQSLGRSQMAWTAASILSCACGMATKEVMVTAPIVVAMWDYVFGGRDRRQVRRGLLIGLAATWVILGALVYGEQRGPSVSLQPAVVWQYLITQSAVIVHYLRLAVFPVPLAFLYDWPLAVSVRYVLPQALFVTAAAGLAIVATVRRHPAGFLGAWFFLVLAPSSSVLPIVTEVAAEHRMYLPLAAYVTAVVMGLFLVGRRLRWGGDGSRIRLAAGVLLTAAAVAVLGVEARARSRVYANEVQLWQDTVNTRPNDARPRVAYGVALASAGRMPEAEAQLQAGVALAPTDPVARVRLASVLARQNKLDAAIPHLDYALTLRPDDGDAHRFLGEIYAVRRQDELARAHLEQALAAQPGDAMLAARLASILADSRDPMVRNGARALTLAAQAVSLTDRRDARMLEILSVAQAAVGRLSEAAATAREALERARLNGDWPLVRALEYRASAYDQAARQGSGPRQ